MKNKRRDHAFSGVFSELIALGGNRFSHIGPLDSCEKYIVSLDKWVKLPNLNMSRASAGSVVLHSLRAFCFCGLKFDGKQLNSIESIELNASKPKWKMLSVNEKIP